LVTSSNDSVARHCDEIERCNQRGDRMLTLPDLVQAGTMDLPMAGYLMAAVSSGASFMVGCVPGGGGKTTVMGALLNVGPADVEFAGRRFDGHLGQGFTPGRTAPLLHRP
jgi:hypothetical protein